MNPFDALLIPPALLKRALDDLHDIAQLARRAAGMEDELRARIAGLERRLDTLIGELEPMHHLTAIRAGIEPLEQSMLAVRDSVDELEPMIEDLDKRIQLDRAAARRDAGIRRADRRPRRADPGQPPPPRPLSRYGLARLLPMRAREVTDPGYSSACST